MTNSTLFSQIISKLDHTKFKILAEQHKTDKHQKSNSIWTQLVSMLFCPFAKSKYSGGFCNGQGSATANLLQVRKMIPEDWHQYNFIYEIIELKNQTSKDKYPKRLRKVVYLGMMLINRRLSILQIKYRGFSENRFLEM